VEELQKNQTAKDTMREKRRKYYEANKYSLCHKMVNVHCDSKTKKARDLYSDRVDSYISRYPFEQYADSYIKKQLAICKISLACSHYHDCYDAGMMAYLYSIHRCAEMSYSHVEAYIKKVVRIYIICALVIHDDSKNLCHANNFRQVRLDDESSFNKF